MTATEMGVAELTRLVVSVRESRAEKKRAWEAEDAHLGRQLDDLRHLRDLAVAGVPASVTERALTLLEIRAGDMTLDPEGMLAKIVEDVAAGCPKLAIDYGYVKNYDRFRGQGGWCEYGRAPTHGCILWSVGLAKRVRDRGIRPLLTEDEVEVATRYLLALKAGIG